MDAEQIILQLFQHGALRRRSLEQGQKINTYNKPRIAFMKGAVEGVELVIKSLNLEKQYQDWRNNNARKSDDECAGRGDGVVCKRHYGV